MTARRKTRAVAMVSGGLDSVVALALAHRDLDVRLVLFFDYAQRSRDSERASVLSVASYYGLPFREVDISWLGPLSPGGMRADGPRVEGAELRSVDDVWIPNRNGVLINIAAAFAESYGYDAVVTGFNREEAVEFPDNGAEYVERATAALGLSTRTGVVVVSPTIGLDKRGIILAGMEAGAPLSTIWSCYRSGERMCGRCASCRRLSAALEAVPADRRPVIEFDV
jgi:7-cyano-7-deazaguanine synthase